jgi:Cell division septal protein
VSGFPERVMNLCGARGLSFWDVCWISPTEFTCEMSRRDWYALRQAAKNLDCTLTAERRAGVPFFLGRFRRRYVLLAGAAACAAALFFGSFFIWDFTIEGNTSVTDEEILRALQENGITIGTFGFSVDAEDLRNHVLLEIPQLSWITVNVSGCQAQVQVRERVPKPELADRRTPSNLVARRDGLVVQVRALEGEKCVLPGNSVEKGQILISGVRDTDTFGAQVTAGMGEVWARTWYRLTAQMPLRVEKKVYAQREQKRFALIFGTHRINLYGNSSHSGENYDKIATRTHLSFFGVPLPVTMAEEVCRPYTVSPAERSPAEAQKDGEALLKEYLAALVEREGTVSSTLCSVRRQGDVLEVTLTAECREQIGVSSPVYVDTKDSDGGAGAPSAK